jgi:hypothetical protein
MATNKSGQTVNKGASRPGRGDSPINIGGGGGRGRKLRLTITPDDWDLTNIKLGLMELKDDLKGAKKLTLTSDDVTITVPLKGSINLEIAVK